MRRMELQQEASLYHGDGASKSHDGANSAAALSAAARRRKVLLMGFRRSISSFHGILGGFGMNCGW